METGAVHLLYLCFFKRLRNHLRGFLIAAWAGDKIAEFSFPEISFHFPLRPWFFFVSPAYAGKSRWWATPTLPHWDHPRVCGEKANGSDAPDDEEGSPPRMRGKGIVPAVQRSLRRITPAYAGKSLTGSSGITGKKDHPRVCGEKISRPVGSPCRVGSPPRMRGKGKAPRRAGRQQGITPAYAGKSVA